MNAVRPSSRADVVTAAAVVVLTVAVTFLVVRDGTAVWQVLRGACVVGLGTALWLFALPLQSFGRGAVACAVGLVAFAVGLGIGLPHLAKTGMTMASVAGLACLVAGAWLIVAGARAMLRGRRWWVAAPSIVGLLVLVGLASLTVGQAVAATNVPATSVGQGTPAQFGLDYRDVTFTAADGVSLAAWYLPSANGAAVVLRHGAGSTRSDVLEQAAVLARAGYGVLMMDARGHGRSEGVAMDFGWYGDVDVSAGVDFLAAQAEVDASRIGAVGLSMGGEEVIGAAASDPRIRAVVAEGATARTPQDKAWMPASWSRREHPAADRHGHVRRRGRAHLGESSDLPRGAAADAAPRPMLLIAGGAVEEEPHAAREIQSGSPATVSVWVVEGAPHVAGLATQPQQWQERVTTFLDGALQSPPIKDA